MWLAYDNTGSTVVVYDEDALSMVNSYFEIDEEPDFSQGIVRTDGVTWWYEDFPEPIPEPIPEPTLEERVSTLESENDLQDETIIALYEDNLALTEQMASQTSINDGQDASIIEIYELLLNA